VQHHAGRLLECGPSEHTAEERIFISLENMGSIGYEKMLVCLDHLVGI